MRLPTPHMKAIQYVTEQPDYTHYMTWDVLTVPLREARDSGSKHAWQINATHYKADRRVSIVCPRRQGDIETMQADYRKRVGV